MDAAPQTAEKGWCGMSGIYIPGMEMPTNCIDCAFGWNGWCHRINNRAFVEVDMRRHDCPLIPVPDHGRLIDATAKVQTQLYDDEHEDWADVDMTVDEYLGYCHNEVPTIIPADKEEEA